MIGSHRTRICDKIEYSGSLSPCHRARSHTAFTLTHHVVKMFARFAVSIRRGIVLCTLTVVAPCVQLPSVTLRKPAAAMRISLTPSAPLLSSTARCSAPRLPLLPCKDAAGPSSCLLAPYSLLSNISGVDACPSTWICFLTATTPRSPRAARLAAGGVAVASLFALPVAHTAAAATPAAVRWG